MGNCIENTLACFKKAIDLEIGIETDVQLTKDKKLICFHDPFIKINSGWLNIKHLSYEELSAIFEHEREIPSVEELFIAFKNIKYSLRYSCDIRDKQSGFKLLELAEEFDIIDKIEITERNIKTLHRLRKFSKESKLVYTLPENITEINENSINFGELNCLNVKTLNIKSWRANLMNFQSIIDNGFNCYVWGVNSRGRMNKVLSLKYKKVGVSAIYTDYPDRLITLKNKIFNIESQ